MSTSVAVKPPRTRTGTPTVTISVRSRRDEDFPDLTYYAATVRVGRQVIGTIDAYRIDAGHPADVWYTADNVSADLGEITSCVLGYGDYGQIGEVLDRRVEAVLAPVEPDDLDCLIVIDTVVLDPESRGHGYGPAAVRLLLDRIARNLDEGALVALHPYAMRTHGAPQFTAAGKKAADVKVRRAWASAGFSPVRGLPIMVRALYPVG